ncbi:MULTISPECIES: site-specific DNA-methyltransferase [Bacteroides]|uniref:site-specific DNA-methyltransferase n=1 Tax=Bacteroides TaxID=816 RepID=UPI000E42ED6C|nr:MULTISPECIES: site-specific DNA-methyltransferase [Bacteroides]MBS7573880.1 site-specific DNA-methyltransferase [Bacteroides propionicigenes]RGM24692.1 site-specific DNA-methyltransferase [Bacteroides sp. OM08-17BH]HBO07023.1 site-specific DNA-methyltransferase [Bacteroides sp.]
MDKLRMQTNNQADVNFRKLAELFPNIVTETIDENGKTVRAIDKDLLMQEISTAVVEGREERYQFTWPDKRKAILAANAPSTNTLRPCEKESFGEFNTTENLYIEGDNLEVLKLLQENYLETIKLIYIDPPYNTGKEFVYPDKFSQTTAEYMERSGQLDEEGYILSPNMESNGRFHTDWLNMMYPRLKIARNLLTKDGVIFISIDQNEVENLKKICCELYGTGNFVGEIIWQSATDNNPRQISTEHEYILCFAKDINSLNPWLIESDKAQEIITQYKLIKHQTNDIQEQQKLLRQWIKRHESELKGVAHYNNVDARGVYSNSTNSSNTKPGGYTFDIIHPTTGKPCVKPVFGWRWTERTFWDYDKNGDIEWGKDETTQPHVKKRIETVKEQFKSIYYEDGRASTKQLEQLLDGKKIFDNPKSVQLLSRIISFATQDDDCTILDFFSGTATTAHAVMEMNAKNGTHKKFIMVQIQEPTDAKSEAYKAGFKNICEIGKERIRKAAALIKKTYPGASFDSGFRVLKLDTSNMQQVWYTPTEYVAKDLFELTVDNIKPDRTDGDLLFQTMLELDCPLSSRLESFTINEKKVYSIADGYIMACFETGVTDETISKIAQKRPRFFVMRDSSMANDSIAVNFEQLFKSYSPDTHLKVY